MDWDLVGLRKSSQNRVLSGVCGGLSEHTPVPALVWRLIFVLSLLAGGAGLLVYALMWWLMPAAGSSGSSAAAEWDLHSLHRSDSDCELEGICGGLGECTPVPSWLWRVAFVSLVFAGGIGAVAYLLLWICLPKARHAVN